MCDGRLFASSPFRRLASRGAPFRGFPFRWVLRFALSLTRCPTGHYATSYAKENLLFEYSRPCDNLSITVLWLQQSQSFFGAGDSASEGYRPNLFQDVPDQSRHMPTSGSHVIGLACGSLCKIRSFQIFALSLEVPSDDQRRDTLPASRRSRWKQNTLQAPPQVLQRITGWDGCGPLPF